MEKENIRRFEFILEKNNSQIRAFDSKASFIIIIYLAAIGFLVNFMSTIPAILFYIFLPIFILQVIILLFSLRPRSSTRNKFKSITYFNTIYKDFYVDKKNEYKEYLDCVVENKNDIYEKSIVRSIVYTSKICYQKERLIKIATLNFRK